MRQWELSEVCKNTTVTLVQNAPLRTHPTEKSGPGCLSPVLEIIKEPHTDMHTDMLAVAE